MPIDEPHDQSSARQTASDPHAQEIQARTTARRGGDSGQEPLTRTEVERMISDAIGRLQIVGAGVSGSPKSGWAINFPPITLTAVCNDDSTITITAQG